MWTVLLKRKTRNLSSMPEAVTSVHTVLQRWDSQGSALLMRFKSKVKSKSSNILIYIFLGNSWPFPPQDAACVVGFWPTQNNVYLKKFFLLFFLEKRHSVMAFTLPYSQRKKTVQHYELVKVMVPCVEPGCDCSPTAGRKRGGETVGY